MLSSDLVQIVLCNSLSKFYTKKGGDKLIDITLLDPSLVERYQTESLRHLKKCKQRFECPVHVCCLYWLPDKRCWPNLIGQVSSDILEMAGIIENDRLNENYSGSQIVGLDKGNPRVEIEIRAV
jgi:hypothetical protein